jgi:hypothetical protein
MQRGDRRVQDAWKRLSSSERPKRRLMIDLVCRVAVFVALVMASAGLLIIALVMFGD